MSQPLGDPQNPPADPPKPGPPNPQPPNPAPPADLDEKKFSQRDYNTFEANIKRQYQNKSDRDKELIEKGKKWEAQEQEQQPLADRVSSLSGEKVSLQAENDSLRSENLRIRLAAAAQLAPQLWDRVRGNTEEEILADIETLKPVGSTGTPPASQQQQPGPTPNRQQGNPSPNDGKTGSIASGRDLFKQRAGITNSSGDDQ